MRDAMRFVERTGIVLESGRGPVPILPSGLRRNVSKAVGGEHRSGSEIFLVTRKLRGLTKDPVCRLVDRKITFVHRRLWPTLLRLAHRFPKKRLASVV